MITTGILVQITLGNSAVYVITWCDVGMSWSSPYQASRVAGSDGDVIGTGSNHIVSAYHHSNRLAMFKHQHQQHLRYLPKGYSSSSSAGQM